MSFNHIHLASSDYTINMKMRLTASLAIINALLTHYLLIMVTSIANHTSMPKTSFIGFNFQLSANHEGPYHSIHRDSDGFLHFQSKLSSSVANVTTLHPETFNPEYLVHEASVVVGTGGGLAHYFLKIDNSASLTWLQCKPCAPAAKQLNAIFEPTDSTTFHYVGSSIHVCQNPYHLAGDKCAFHIAGPRGLSVHGFLAHDRFIKDNTENHKDFIFGCAHSTENFESQGRYAGVLTMGRTPSSLAMQAAAKGLTQFSYCLGWGSKTKLTFGTYIPRDPNSRTTRILPPLETHESEYYFSFVGISLGTRKLDKIHPEMFARRMNGQGGCVIDIGTPLSVMADKAYHIIEETIWSDLQHHQAKRVNKHGFSLCVEATDAILRYLPSMSLHFSEEESVMVFSPKQMFLMMNEKQAQIACLAMKPGQQTTIGAFQQVDTRFIYDVKDSKLSFTPESCVQGSVEPI